MTRRLDPGVVPVATIVTDAAADALAWHPLGSDPGVDYKLLWRSGKSVAGMLRLAPGAELTPHAHVRSHHHLWVTEGTAEVLGELVGPGTYVHIPARVDHGIRASGDQACTMLYLYLRDESAGAP
jgi:mannose-6-phosphate isomerase-like protein (cupin superfamily)